MEQTSIPILFGKDEDKYKARFFQRKGTKIYDIGILTNTQLTLKRNDVVCVAIQDKFNPTKTKKVLSCIKEDLGKEEKVVIENMNFTYRLYSQKPGAYFTNIKIPHPTIKDRFTFAMATVEKPEIGDVLTVRSKTNKGLDAFIVSSVKEVGKEELKNLKTDTGAFRQETVYLVERKTERFVEIDNSFPLKTTLEKFIQYVRSLIQRKKEQWQNRKRQNYPNRQPHGFANKRPYNPNYSKPREPNFNREGYNQNSNSYGENSGYRKPNYNSYNGNNQNWSNRYTAGQPKTENGFRKTFEPGHFKKS